MTLTIPDQVLEQMNVKEDILLLEIAALLYEKGSLSFGQAKTLAGLSHLAFQSVLKDRGIPLNYDIDAFHEDWLQLNEETKI